LSAWNDPRYWARFFRLKGVLAFELTWRGVKRQWAITADGITRL
jgi:hypothetical protein